MASFFNIEKNRALLEKTAVGDSYARSLLQTGTLWDHIVRRSSTDGKRSKITGSDELRIIAGGMAEYLYGYSAPASFKARLWDCFDGWIRRIAAELGVEGEGIFAAEIDRPVATDLGVELIKALHDEEGKTKAELEKALGVGGKTIQTELRALDPSLKKSGPKIRPLRIAGQEMHPSIRFRIRPDGNNPRSFERVYYMPDRLHPLALQLNTQQVGTLLLSLFRMNEETDSMLSREMAIDIWCQLSSYGQSRIREVFGKNNGLFTEFLDDISAELQDGRLLAFHTEDEMSEDAMSPDELIMAAFKGGKECMIEIRKDEETIRLDRARIVMADGEADVWLAIRADKYPDRTKALRFTKAEIRKIRLKE